MLKTPLFCLLSGVAMLGCSSSPSSAGWFDAPKIPTCAVTFGAQSLHFAHCDGAERDFTTVIVAVPGWNGSCGATFGTGPNSMYTVLDSRRFYDWDCYDYDSHAWHIQDSAKGLAKQIAALRADGYKNILFVTHSTGGIVVLEYLTQRLFGYTSTNGTYSRLPSAGVDVPQDLKMPEAVMWAAPINGLNWDISLAGNFTGDDEQTLPDLQQDSPYLDGLKQRLVDYYAWKETLPPDQQLHARIDLLFLQSDTDGVVRTIDAESGRPSWLWPLPEGEVEKTGEWHLGIGDTGTANALHVPTAFNNYLALIKAPLDVRLQDVFLGAAATGAAEARQDAVISGVTYFSSQQFQAALVPALKLMNFMLGNDFVRSAHVDGYLVDALLKLFDQEFSDPDVATEAAALFQTIAGHDFGVVSATVAGANAPEYVEKVAELLDKIRTKSGRTDALGLKIDEGALAAEANIATKAQAGAVRDFALNLVKSEVASASPAAIVDSQVITKLTADFYVPNASSLPDSSKKLMADILTNALGRGGDLGASALASVSTPLSFRNQTQPLWRSLQQPAFTTYLDNFSASQNLATATAEQKSQLLQLDLDLLKGVGTTGNQPTVAANALERLKQGAVVATPGTKDLFVKLNQKSTLDDIKNWPGLKNKAATVFNAYGAGPLD